MIKLLWVDDDLHRDLRERRINLLMDDEFDADFATDATDAYYKLIDKQNGYNAVLLDLQHPAGPDDMWHAYRDRGERMYGAILLRMVREDADGKFSHLKNTRFGVLSIHPEEANKDFFESPMSLPKANYLEKEDALNDKRFIDFILNLEPFSL